MFHSIEKHGEHIVLIVGIIIEDFEK